MSGNIADGFSEGVLNPTSLVPFNLDVDSFLGVRRGFGLIASFRLLPRCVIQVSEETFS